MFISYFWLKWWRECGFTISNSIGASILGRGSRELALQHSASVSGLVINSLYALSMLSQHLEIWYKHGQFQPLYDNGRTGGVASGVPIKWGMDKGCLLGLLPRQAITISWRHYTQRDQQYNGLAYQILTISYSNQKRGPTLKIFLRSPPN